MAAAAPPSVARIPSCALWGLEAALVTVEVDVANGLPAFSVVGPRDVAISEARERVRAAIRNSGFEFPLRRVVANLAPAERKKEGAGFDLAIALGVLHATGQLTRDVGSLCLGELALDGSVRPVRGVLPASAAPSAPACATCSALRRTPRRRPRPVRTRSACRRYATPWRILPATRPARPRRFRRPRWSRARP